MKRLAWSLWGMTLFLCLCAASLGGCGDTPGERPEDAAVLRQIGEAMKVYAGEHKGAWPSATAPPETCLPDPKAFADQSELLARLKDPTKPRLCYLGYVVDNERAAMAVLDEFERSGGQAMPDSDIRLPQPLPFTVRQERDIIRFREGAERYYICDISNPAAGAQAQQDVLVMWEVPDEGSKGGWALYLDGGVVWIPYPGPFPMTQDWVERCRRFTSSTAENPPPPQAESPVKPLAERAAHILEFSEQFPGHFDRYPKIPKPDWMYSPACQCHVARCDAAPATVGRDITGYRVELCIYWPRRDRQGGDETGDGTEQVDCRFVQLVLLKETAGLAPELNAIEWENLPGDPHSVELCLGKRFGYRWYARGTPAELTDLRHGMQLEGGDDPIKPLLDAYHGWHDYDVLRRIVREGGSVAVFPRLEAELHAASEDEREAVIRTFESVPGSQSVALLERLYHSGNRLDSDAAAESLGLDPLPLESKEACLAALAKGLGSYGNEDVAAAISAAAIGRWPETLPYLEKLLRRQHSPRTYRRCWCAIRAVEGKPVPRELEEAFGVLRRMRSPWVRAAVSDRDIARAKDVIARTSDSEAATIMALEYAADEDWEEYEMQRENPLELQALAKEIVRALPRDVALRVLSEVKTEPIKSERTVDTIAWSLRRELDPTEE